MTEVILALVIVIVFIFSLFLGVAILSAPGVLVRWLFSGRKKPFKELYRERVFLNYFLGLITVLVLYIAVILIIKL